MKVSLAIHGHAREIDLDRSGAQIAAAEPGVYSVLLEGRSYEARIEQSGGCVIVFINGHRFEVEIRDPRRWSGKIGKPGGDGRSNVASPMPGKIVRLLVAAGETVTAGQGLLVVEAMKMQNELKSPKKGTIQKILVREGATVNAGDVLAIVE